MNIFEALEKGNGKATFQNTPGVNYTSYERGRFLWQHSKLTISDCDVFIGDLKRNDWIPYVPREERKIEGMIKFTNPWDVYYYTINEWRKMGYRDDYIEKFVIKPNVPRGTCSNCGFPSYPGRTIKLTSDFKCEECGRSFEFTTPPKTKHCECENIQSGERVEVDFNQKCIKCGKQFNFILAKTKTKHKEVFENVRWAKDQNSGIVYPYGSFDVFIYEKTKSKTTKMTLEWEE